VSIKLILLQRGYKGIVMIIGGNILTAIKNKAVKDNPLAFKREYEYAAGKLNNTTRIAAPNVVIALLRKDAQYVG
jgi:hypothetical protein